MPTDLNAFGEIVETHQAAIRAFLSVRLDDPFEAHDLAQEVFLIAWKRIDEIDLDRPLRPWLLKVAAHLILKHRRKGRAIPMGGNDAILELLHGRIEKMAETSLGGPIFEALESCLGELGEASRRLIELRYSEGWGIRDIVKEVGGKHSAMTMKLHRLRAILYECILGKTKAARP